MKLLLIFLCSLLYNQNILLQQYKLDNQCYFQLSSLKIKFYLYSSNIFTLNSTIRLQFTNMQVILNPQSQSALINCQIQYKNINHTVQQCRCIRQITNKTVCQFNSPVSDQPSEKSISIYIGTIRNGLYSSSDIMGKIFQPNGSNQSFVVSVFYKTCSFTLNSLAQTSYKVSQTNLTYNFNFNLISDIPQNLRISFQMIRDNNNREVRLSNLSVTQLIIYGQSYYSTIETGFIQITNPVIQNIQNGEIELAVSQFTNHAYYGDSQPFLIRIMKEIQIIAEKEIMATCNQTGQLKIQQLSYESDLVDQQTKIIIFDTDYIYVPPDGSFQIQVPLQIKLSINLSCQINRNQIIVPKECVYQKDSSNSKNVITIKDIGSQRLHLLLGPITTPRVSIEQTLLFSIYDAKNGKIKESSKSLTTKAREFQNLTVRRNSNQLEQNTNIQIEFTIPRPIDSGAVLHLYFPKSQFYYDSMNEPISNAILIEPSSKQITIERISNSSFQDYYVYVFSELCPSQCPANGSFKFSFEGRNSFYKEDERQFFRIEVGKGQQFSQLYLQSFVYIVPELKLTELQISFTTSSASNLTFSQFNLTLVIGYPQLLVNSSGLLKIQFKQYEIYSDDNRYQFYSVEEKNVKDYSKLVQCNYNECQKVLFQNLKLKISQGKLKNFTINTYTQQNQSISLNYIDLGIQVVARTASMIIQPLLSKVFQFTNYTFLIELAIPFGNQQKGYLSINITSIITQNTFCKAKLKLQPQIDLTCQIQSNFLRVTHNLNMYQFVNKQVEIDLINVLNPKSTKAQLFSAQVYFNSQKSQIFSQQLILQQLAQGSYNQYILSNNIYGQSSTLTLNCKFTHQISPSDKLKMNLPFTNLRNVRVNNILTNLQEQNGFYFFSTVQSAFNIKIIMDVNNPESTGILEKMTVVHLIDNYDSQIVYITIDSMQPKVLSIQIGVSSNETGTINQISFKPNKSNKTEKMMISFSNGIAILNQAMIGNQSFENPMETTLDSWIITVRNNWIVQQISGQIVVQGYDSSNLIVQKANIPAQKIVPKQPRLSQLTCTRNELDPNTVTDVEITLKQQNKFFSNSIIEIKLPSQEIQIPNTFLCSIQCTQTNGIITIPLNCQNECQPIDINFTIQKVINRYPSLVKVEILIKKSGLLSQKFVGSITPSISLPQFQSPVLELIPTISTEQTIKFSFTVNQQLLANWNLNIAIPSNYIYSKNNCQMFINNVFKKNCVLEVQNGWILTVGIPLGSLVVKGSIVVILVDGQTRYDTRIPDDYIVMQCKEGNQITIRSLISLQQLAPQQLECQITRSSQALGQQVSYTFVPQFNFKIYSPLVFIIKIPKELIQNISSFDGMYFDQNDPSYYIMMIQRNIVGQIIIEGKNKQKIYFEELQVSIQIQYASDQFKQIMPYFEAPTLQTELTLMPTQVFVSSTTTLIVQTSTISLADSKLTLIFPIFTLYKQNSTSFTLNNQLVTNPNVQYTNKNISKITFDLQNQFEAQNIKVVIQGKNSPFAVTGANRFLKILIVIGTYVQYMGQQSLPQLTASNQGLQIKREISTSTSLTNLNIQLSTLHPIFNYQLSMNIEGSCLKCIQENGTLIVPLCQECQYFNIVVMDFINPNVDEETWVDILLFKDDVIAIKGSIMIQPELIAFPLILSVVQQKEPQVESMSTLQVSTQLPQEATQCLIELRQYLLNQPISCQYKENSVPCTLEQGTKLLINFKPYKFLNGLIKIQYKNYDFVYFEEENLSVGFSKPWSSGFHTVDFNLRPKLLVFNITLSNKTISSITNISLLILPTHNNSKLYFSIPQPFSLSNIVSNSQYEITDRQIQVTVDQIGLVQIIFVDQSNLDNNQTSGLFQVVEKGASNMLLRGKGNNSFVADLSEKDLIESISRNSVEFLSPITLTLRIKVPQQIQQTQQLVFIFNPYSSKQIYKSSQLTCKLNNVEVICVERDFFVQISGFCTTCYENEIVLTGFSNEIGVLDYENFGIQSWIKRKDRGFISRGKLVLIQQVGKAIQLNIDKVNLSPNFFLSQSNLQISFRAIIKGSYSFQIKSNFLTGSQIQCYVNQQLKQCRIQNNIIIIDQLCQCQVINIVVKGLFNGLVEQKVSLYFFVMSQQKIFTIYQNLNFNIDLLPYNLQFRTILSPSQLPGPSTLTIYIDNIPSVSIDYEFKLDDQFLKTSRLLAQLQQVLLFQNVNLGSTATTKKFQILSYYGVNKVVTGSKQIVINSQTTNNCKEQCYTCSLKPSYKCFQCKQKKVFNQQKCQSSCPSNKFQLNNQCYQCSLSCVQCYGPTSYNCKKCSQDKVVYQGKCIPTQQCYLQVTDGICMKNDCKQGCETCSDNDYCYSCKERYFFEQGKCKQENRLVPYLFFSYFHFASLIMIIVLLIGSFMGGFTGESLMGGMVFFLSLIESFNYILLIVVQQFFMIGLFTTLLVLKGTSGITIHQTYIYKYLVKDEKNAKLVTTKQKVISFFANFIGTDSYYLSFCSFFLKCYPEQIVYNSHTLHYISVLKKYARYTSVLRLLAIVLNILGIVLNSSKVQDRLILSMVGFVVSAVLLITHFLLGTFPRVCKVCEWVQEKFGKMK